MMMDGGILAEDEGVRVMYSSIKLSTKPDKPPPPSPWGEMRMNGISMNSVSDMLHEAGCPTDRWVNFKAVIGPDGMATQVEWQDKPFDEELALREAMIPEELRNAFTKLREMDDLDREEGEGIENTYQGLYDRETYLSWEGSKPERFDREPHLEITDIKLGRNFSLPTGAIVRDAKTGEKYIAAVKPNAGGSFFFFASGFEDSSETDFSGEGWNFATPERQPANAPIAGAAVPTKNLADIDISSWDRAQIDRLLRTWGDAIRAELGRKVHGRRVPPGAEQVLNWITQSRERIAKGEGLDEIKVRVSAFLERLDQLEGIPTELPWES